MENINLLGICGNQEMEVAAKDTASVYNSGMLNVFATPAMIALMEKTAMLSVADHLPKTSTTVGTEINVKHLKATPIGKTVKCQSKVIETDGRKIVFEVRAFDGEAIIGEGFHTRFIVDIEKFLSKL